MTTTPSYTDEQVLAVVETCDAMYLADVSNMIRFLFSERKRLQAEVEALRNGAKKLASNWVRHSASGASHSPWVHQDCAEQLRDLLEETRTTHTETKEAKS